VYKIRFQLNMKQELQCDDNYTDNF